MPLHHDNNSVTVLVANSSPFIRIVLRTIVTMAGYRVIETADGTEALDLYSAHKPAVALVEQGLGTSQGENTASAIMASDPAALLIICGGDGTGLMSEDETETEMLGKPYDQERIRELLQRIVSQKKETAGGSFHP